MLLPLLQNLWRSRWRRGLEGGSGRFSEVLLYAEVLKALTRDREKKEEKVERRETVQPRAKRKQKPSAPIRIPELPVPVPPRLVEYPSLLALIQAQEEMARMLRAIEIALEVLDDEEALLLILAAQQ